MFGLDCRCQEYHCLLLALFCYIYPEPWILVYQPIHNCFSLMKPNVGEAFSAPSIKKEMVTVFQNGQSEHDMLGLTKQSKETSFQQTSSEYARANLLQRAAAPSLGPICDRGLDLASKRLQDVHHLLELGPCLVVCCPAGLNQRLDLVGHNLQRQCIGEETFKWGVELDLLRLTKT